MGGAVSSGRDNDELVDNLMSGNYIRTRAVERVFRVLDRAEYMTPDTRDHAYTDQAWRNGPLHMSAPCIYSEVLEGLELKPGMSFLNIGSGTGYFSTLVGLILGPGGVNHGVEVHSYVVEYATKKLGQFIENSPTLDEFDFCEPKFYCGNGLCLAPLQAPYDRVYCGAGCPAEYKNYFKQLIKVGGVLVMPLNDSLVQVRRTGDELWASRNLLNVSFATLRVPTNDETADLLTLEEQCPPRLQVLCRAAVRRSMRAALLARHPQLREPPPAPPRPRNTCPRRISIPIEEDSDVEGLNALHDLEGHASGANEMNALLSLVLSMGHNRVAGALRFDSVDSPSDSSEEDGEGAGAGSGGGDGDDGDDPPDGADPPSIRDDPPRRPSRSITFEFGHDDAPGSPGSHGSHGSHGSAGSHGAHGDGGRTPPLPGARQDAPRDRPGMDGVPAEVEIYLGKEVAGTSRSDMDWEGFDAILESSSEEETTETSKTQKRQKLDSGIGEGETLSGSSPVKSESKSDESEADAVRSTTSGNLTDDVDGDVGTRRRLAKRAHCVLGPHSSSSTECEDSGGEGGEGGEGGADGGAPGHRRKRRAHAVETRVTRVARVKRTPPAPREPRDPRNTREAISDARRARLSVMMKLAVKELPLPYALKKYVNLGRSFAISASA